MFSSCSQKTDQVQVLCSDLLYFHCKDSILLMSTCLFILYLNAHTRNAKNKRLALQIGYCSGDDLNVLKCIEKKIHHGHLGTKIFTMKIECFKGLHMETYRLLWVSMRGTSSTCKCKVVNCKVGSFWKRMRPHLQFRK